ncbi:MAG: hypothetical protein IJL78_08205 [Lachnospiraceae bacterium]|nr:hypothetical protein [Lachnospiraceae bacterium]
MDKNRENIDQILIDAIDKAEVPKDVDSRINPWKHQMMLALWGLVISSVLIGTPQVVGIVQQAIGIILMLTGLRSFRRENKCFFAAWILTICRVVLFTCVIAVDASVYKEVFHASAIGKVTDWIQSAVLAGIMISLWKAFETEFRKTGHPAGTTGFVIQLLVMAIAVFTYIFRMHLPLALILLLFAVVIAAFVFILKIPQKLENTGYIIKTTPVKVSNIVHIIILSCIFIAIVAASGIIWSGYKMKWDNVEDAQISLTEAERAELQEKLTDLEIPEKVVEDLSDDDLVQCQNAVCADTVKDDWYFSVARSNDTKHMRVTRVLIALNEDETEWKVIHHFCWVSDQSFSGNDAIRLEPADLQPVEGIARKGQITGRLLYTDPAGVVYEAPFPILEFDQSPQPAIDFGSQATSSCYTAFSWPKQGRDCRCYLSYCVEIEQPGVRIFSLAYYIHNTGAVRFPCQTALDYAKAPGFSAHEKFEQRISN